MAQDHEFNPGPEFAAAADREDPLARFRERFYIPQLPEGGEAIYFTGNSLGLQPKTAREYINAELDDWARLGVEGHIHARHPWLPYHEFVTESLARVAGAKPIEVVAMNSLTVNLHLLMVSFYRPTAERHKIVIERGAFPSDQYAVESQIKVWSSAFRRLSDEVGPAKVGTPSLIELTPREGEATLRTEDILELIDREGESIALIMLGGVNYYTGQAFDMAAITEAGHRKGCVVGFDLAHAAGNLELHLHDWNVDFAAWCSYKYLNSGPGGIAGIFVHERHARSFELPRFAGWWGHDKATRFLMGPEFVPLAGAEGWQLSNPPIFQLAALRASLEIFDEATIPALRTKSERLTGYLEYLLGQIATERIELITPADPQQRGCQLSIRVRDADKQLFDAITARGVFADWREPDVIRVAPVPLYNSFADVFRFSEVIGEALR
ncbi:MAG: kynureninase [Acidobacteria bacterium]|nr:kynureninase [Acidobacteriota bacterium]